MDSILIYYVRELVPDYPHLTRNTVTAHATKIPGLIFLSGQTPVADGKVVPGGIKEHTVSCDGLLACCG